MKKKKSAFKKPAKYKNKRFCGYQSKREWARAVKLKQDEKKGLISNLREQVPYQLLPNQLDEGGKCLERAVKYYADFVYVDANGVEVVEDAKGAKTKEYIIKRKLMLEVHGIRIVEV